MSISYFITGGFGAFGSVATPATITETVVIPTDQQMLDRAKASLYRILETDADMWSEGERKQANLNIANLQGLIDRYDTRAARANSRIHRPIRRINF